jgi:nicotinate-nucleotide pyrophosphorylase (carboxylating)
VKIEIEVDTLDQLREVLAVGGADVALLDNMSPPTCAKRWRWSRAAWCSKRQAGSHIKPAAAVAETGVDYLSSGAITHSAPNLDVALDIEM